MNTNTSAVQAINTQISSLTSLFEEVVMKAFENAFWNTASKEVKTAFENLYDNSVVYYTDNADGSACRLEITNEAKDIHNLFTSENVGKGYWEIVPSGFKVNLTFTRLKYNFEELERLCEDNEDTNVEELMKDGNKMVDFPDLDKSKVLVLLMALSKDYSVKG